MHRPNALTRNAVQCSGSILGTTSMFRGLPVASNLLVVAGQSRCLLFGRILVFLRYFDARKIEVVYSGEDTSSSSSHLLACQSRVSLSLPADTDSIILCASSSDLRSCIRPEFEEQFDHIAAFLFERPEAEVHQCGYLKVSIRQCLFVLFDKSPASCSTAGGHLPSLLHPLCQSVLSIGGEQRRDHGHGRPTHAWHRSKAS
jgi:hypothetical protein